MMEHKKIGVQPFMVESDDDGKETPSII